MLTPSCFWNACARRSAPAQRGGTAEQLERCSSKRSRRGASASELAAGERALAFSFWSAILTAGAGVATRPQAPPQPPYQQAANYWRPRTVRATTLSCSGTREPARTQQPPPRSPRPGRLRIRNPRAPTRLGKPRILAAERLSWCCKAADSQAIAPVPKRVRPGSGQLHYRAGAACCREARGGPAAGTDPFRRGLLRSTVTRGVPSCKVFG